MSDKDVAITHVSDREEVFNCDTCPLQHPVRKPAGNLEMVRLIGTEKKCF